MVRYISFTLFFLLSTTATSASSNTPLPPARLVYDVSLLEKVAAQLLDMVPNKAVNLERDRLNNKLQNKLEQAANEAQSKLEAEQLERKKLQKRFNDLEKDYFELKTLSKELHGKILILETRKSGLEALKNSYKQSLGELDKELKRLINDSNTTAEMALMTAEKKQSDLYFQRIAEFANSINSSAIALENLALKSNIK